jgi:exodeoxyribonuclease VII small subunit
MTTEKKSEAGFEQDLEKLEAIVEALEEGGLPLEKSLKQFETGIQLARKCEKALRQAEQKIEMLVRGMDGEMEAQPFDQGEAPSETDSPKPKKAAPKKAEAAPAAEAPVEEEPPDSVYDDEDEDMDALF